MSSVFQLCRFTVFPKDPHFRLFKTIKTVDFWSSRSHFVHALLVTNILELSEGNAFYSEDLNVHLRIWGHIENDFSNSLKGTI